MLASASLAYIPDAEALNERFLWPGILSLAFSFCVSLMKVLWPSNVSLFCFLALLFIINTLSVLWLVFLHWRDSRFAARYFAHRRAYRRARISDEAAVESDELQQNRQAMQLASVRSETLNWRNARMSYLLRFCSILGAQLATFPVAKGMASADSTLLPRPSVVSETKDLPNQADS